MNAKRFGEIVRHYRIQRGWDQHALAERIHKSTPTVSRIEHGTQAVTLEIIQALSDAFEVSLWHAMAEGELSQIDLIRQKALSLPPEQRDLVIALLEAFAAQLKSLPAVATRPVVTQLRSLLMPALV